MTLPAAPLHVLVLALDYPPNPAVGAIRPAALVRQLVERAHRVTVLTAALPGEAPGHRAAEGVERVLTLKVRENPARWWARRYPRKQSDPSVLTPPARHHEEPERTKSQLRRWLLSVLLLPDEWQGFIVPATTAARQLVRESGVNLIYSTAPPFSTHLAGLALSIGKDVPWMAEFRDPWGGGRRRSNRRSAFSNRLEAQLEAATIRRATRLVAVTPAIARGLDQARQCSGQPADTLVALNGVPSVAAARTTRHGPVTILHAGELYLGRDPRPFLEATARAVREQGLLPQQLSVVFMGAGGDSFGGIAVKTMARELGVEAFVQVEGHLPIDECRRRMAEADVLLLLAQQQPAQVPNKLYDYFAARRPIVAYADAGGESAALLTQVGGHCLIPDHSPDHHSRVIEAIVKSRDTPSGAGMDEKVLASLNTDAQLGKVVDAIEEAAARHRARALGLRPGPR